jgi:general secretion pathway protein D
VKSRSIVVTLAGLSFLWAADVQAQARRPVPPPVSPNGAAREQKVTPGSAAEKVPEKQLITMDFQDVEIGVLVKFISEITGKNFILDEKVRGKVTVISPTKITIDEAYRVFQSILEVKGFTTLPAGPVTKIVPVREARESGAPLATKSAAGDQYITQLVPLSFTDASTLVPVLQPMVSKDGLISAYDPSNTIVLIDTASNIERLLSIISELDIELPERGLEVIHLDNAYAEAVAQTLQQVLEAQTERTASKPGAPPAPRPAGQPGPAGAAGAGTPSPFKIVADERTNSVIAFANPSQMRTIRNLVKQLDKKLEGVSKINVYQLRYANASEMVDVLSQLISGGGGAGGGFGGRVPQSLGGTGNSRRQTRQQIQRQSSLGQGGLGGRFGGGLGIGGQLGGGGTPPGGSNAAAAGSASGGGGEFIGEVRVTADPYTNSLVISAGPQDYDVLKRVIAELDIPRRQVFVEAIIFEISLDKSRQLGFEYQGGTQLGDQAIGLGRLNFTNLNQALTTPQSLQGLVLAAASNQTITLPDGTKVPAQVALFTALQADRDVNVLSAPTILTSDNQEAEILVGQNVPFIASRATSETNLNNTFATVDRQDVGISLRLTPQISQGDVVRLDLYEEVSALVPNPAVDANIAGPTTTVRSASTTIVAKNGQTVALGGLISDQVTNTQSKIPFVGDIPVIGNFFKNNDDRRNKINLLIFLTPHIVYDEADLHGYSLEERARFKKQLDQQRTGPRHRDQLDAPSWNTPQVLPRNPATQGSTPYTPPPAYPPLETVPPASSAQPSTSSAYPPPENAAPPPAVASRAAPAAPPPISPSSPNALGIPTTGHRFVVLLALYERGTEPPELTSTNGFLTLYTPSDAGDFFTKGQTYEYKSSTFEAKYNCLEVFTDAATALSVYPEGRPLERWGGALVRWRPVSSDQMRAMIAGNSPW